MNRLQREIDDLPKPEDAVDDTCSGDDASEDGMTSFVGCNDGVKQLLAAPDGCSVIRSLGGKWVIDKDALLFHPIERKLVKSFVSPGTYTVTLPDFPTKACGKIYAHFQTEMAWTGTTTNGSSIRVKVGSFLIAFGGAVSGYNFGDAAAAVTAADTVFVADSPDPIDFAAAASVYIIGYSY